MCCSNPKLVLSLAAARPNVYSAKSQVDLSSSEGAECAQRNGTLLSSGALMIFPDSALQTFGPSGTAKH